jgi:hypothetical protein
MGRKSWMTLKRDRHHPRKKFWDTCASRQKTLAKSSSGSGNFIYPSLVNNPQTYITTVGLYNDTNELLAVAKMSKALPKDFTKEAYIRVKLDF